eukprot:scaffold286609_cov31-Tisochrysis_lutea.AAC.1
MVCVAYLLPTAGERGNPCLPYSAKGRIHMYLAIFDARPGLQVVGPRKLAARVLPRVSLELIAS